MQATLPTFHSVGNWPWMIELLMTLHKPDGWGPIGDQVAWLYIIRTASFTNFWRAPLE